MLRLALASELEAVALFNASAQECRALGDHGTASLFDAMVLAEGAHGAWFEAPLQAIEAIGIPASLAPQVAPGKAP